MYSNQFSKWENDTHSILAKRKHTNGYLRVSLSINNTQYDRYIHRLVATEFCENHNPSKYKEVNHIDGNKENNIFTNLEWCDRSYNNKHSYIKGLHGIHGCYGNKKSVVKIDIETNKIVEIYDSVYSAAKAMNLKSFSNISACCNYAENPTKYKRPCLSAKGYRWMFLKDNMKVGDII